MSIIPTVGFLRSGVSFLLLSGLSGCAGTRKSTVKRCWVWIGRVFLARCHYANYHIQSRQEGHLDGIPSADENARRSAKYNTHGLPSHDLLLALGACDDFAGRTSRLTADYLIQFFSFFFLSPRQTTSTRKYPSGTHNTSAVHPAIDLWRRVALSGRAVDEK